jgi:DNA-directed RNA polymerase subunit M/transcription elongation factor TFIIS
MIRLGFRDILWYCYLDQNKLDNSFFRLDDPVRQTKSRYAIRYVLGYYTERLETLQGQLVKAASDRMGKIGAVSQMRELLQEVGYSSEKDIQPDIEEVERQLKGATGHQAELENTFHVDTHFADVLRERLRVLSSVLGQEEQTLADIHQRLAEFQALKSELITARQKLSRSQAASTVLSGVSFESCPQCGTHLPTEDSARDESVLNCNLCGQLPPKANEDRATHLQVAKRDLGNRLQEIEETIARSQRSVRKQEQRVSTVRHQKTELDLQLQNELRLYDSAFLAQAREVDRRRATLVERLNGLQRFRKIPETITRLEQEANQLVAEQDRLRRAIQEEQASLVSADSLVKELEEKYLEVLLTVGVPGVGHDDLVRMNRKSWIPDILEGGQEDQGWNFLSAGSNGKKTLLNVCYALAVHQVAASHARPLPSLLIIDHPTKCISPDVNRTVIEALYRYIYDLLQGSLKDTQVILIDNDFFAPEGQEVQLFQRYMTPSDDGHPPLISYYRGA